MENRKVILCRVLVGALIGGGALMRVASWRQAERPAAIETVRPKMVASFVFDGQRLAYPQPVLEPQFQAAHRGETIVGTYRLCADTSGAVTEVLPIRGIASQDESIAAQLKRGWRYQPQAMPVCHVREFKFVID